MKENDNPDNLMISNVGRDKCPVFGAIEVDSGTPRTVYACGSSDYDNRPGTFNQSNRCVTSMAVRPEKAEK